MSLLAAVIFCTSPMACICLDVFLPVEQVRARDNSLCLLRSNDNLSEAQEESEGFLLRHGGSPIPQFTVVLIRFLGFCVVFRQLKVASGRETSP